MKIERQQLILQIIRSQDIYNQGELTEALAKAGFNVAQATVSRDIRELRLTKETTDSGQKYTAPTGENEPIDRLHRIFREGVVTASYAGNMMVLHTLSGMAMAVALALDNMGFTEILGSVAGDDTVISVIQSEADAAKIVERLAI